MHLLADHIVTTIGAGEGGQTVKDGGLADNLGKRNETRLFLELDESLKPTCEHRPLEIHPHRYERVINRFKNRNPTAGP